MAVHEQQSEAAAGAQGEETAKQNRAVAPDYERRLAAVEDLANRFGERKRIGGDRRRVKHSCVRIDHGPAVVWLLHPGRTPRIAQRLSQSGIQQRPW